MSTDTQQLERAIDELVDEYRHQCLWFLRSDFYPMTLDQKLRILNYIERYGDRTAYHRAAEARQWLLQSSSETSAAGEGRIESLPGRPILRGALLSTS